MATYTELAKSAAKDFLSNDKPLNDSIAKLASDNDLNPTQIQRVSELANKAVHQYGILKVADKNFTFDLADTDKILEKVSAKTSPSSLLSTFAPESRPEVEKIGSIFGNPESYNFDKVEKLRRYGQFGEKLAGAISEVNGRINIAQLNKQAEVQNLRNQITHMKNNGIDPEDIRQTLTAADPQNSGKVNSLMKSIGYEANPKATAGNKSGTPAAKAEDAPIINENHPVVINVKNIFAKDEDINTLDNTKRYLVSQKYKLDKALSASSGYRG